jgi:pimeloyl-ACP methyl ester carboxylesterase
MSATDVTFGWLAQEVARRHPDSHKPTLLLMDGQKSFWEAAGLFYDRDSDPAWEFVYDWVLRMLRGEVRYDEYLAAGYPIASGVIEGACRHVVKDRMERSGMHWTLERAQAMLDVRSLYINGDGDAFMAYRIEKETQRLYPHRALVEPIDMPEGIEMPIAA